MKRALILTASFGGGHNKAADNVRNKLLEKDFEVDEVDLLKEISEKLDSLLVGGYLGIVSKTPELFGLIYKSTNISSSSNLFAQLSDLSNNSSLVILDITSRDILFNFSKSNNAPEDDIFFGEKVKSLNVLSGLLVCHSS